MLIARLRATTAPIVALLVIATGLFASHEALAPRTAAAATSITFEGGGWGHGVGMSQFGAKARADAGHSASDIIAAYYTGTTISTISMPTISVHLATAASTSIQFTGPTTIVTGTGATVQTISAGETVEFRSSGSAWELQVTAPTPRAAVPLDPAGTIAAALGGSPARLAANNNRYHNGQLALRLSNANSIQIVNAQLSMQQYLNGIAEVPASWPAEALKAQALAARTFGYKRALSPRSPFYDILSTTSDQVYVGYEKTISPSGDRWASAVTATDQQVITYQGAPIDAFYSSSNGGITDNSEYVFIATVPYLRSKADPFDNTPSNPNFRWSRTYSDTELQSYLLAYRGVNIGPIGSYEISGNVSPTGRIDRASVKLIGTSGTSTMTGAQLRNMINQSAPSNRQLQSTLLFFRPIGSFDNVSVLPGFVNVEGWSLFQGNTATAYAHVYVNGVFSGSAAADIARPDVAAAIAGAGPTTGYRLGVKVDRAVNTICAYAVTPSGSASTPLGCRSVTVSTMPFGSFDVASPTPGGAQVRGWAMDPNEAGAIAVHVYVNGAFAATTVADRTRPDIGVAFPTYGSDHGYDVTVPVDRMTNTVCAYAINAGPGDSVSLGCKTVINQVQPIGSIDVAASSGGPITVAGWAIDPDTADPIDVHVYVDGKGIAINADGQRDDVARAFPGYGSRHGYATTIDAGGGSHRVCVYAINVNAGSHQLLGCRTVDVPADPFGAVDQVRAGPDGIQVSGWAADPNSAEPIEVHVYIATSGVPTVANLVREDVAAVFPAVGTRRGYDVTIPGSAGQTVCVYAINIGAGANRQLTCRKAS